MKKILTLLAAAAWLQGTTQNWTTVNSPVTNDLNDVCFISDTHGWIVGRQGKVIHTTDGGQTWTEQNSGTTKDLNKVFMVDQSTGYAVGDGGTFIRYNGTTWSTKSINFSQDMTGVFFLDGNEGWISGDWGRIMYTTNGGNSWTNQMTNATYSNKFNDLYMLSSSEGWAVGTSGRVLKYNGTSWSNVSNPAATNLKDLYAVSFSSSTNGFMTGKNSLVYFNDGASLNAHNTALPDNSYHVYDVVTVNPQLAYAATTPGLGGQGMILRYDGITWKKDYEYTGMYSELFYGIASTPSGNVFAVGAGGLIKKKSSGQTTGVTKNSVGARVDVFPVPANDILSVRFSNAGAGEVSVSVYDISGRLLLSADTHTTGSGELTVPASELQPGCYLYRVVAPDMDVTGKFVKN